MEQMMEFLKAMQEMMETQIGSLAFWMEAIQERMDIKLKEVMEDMRAWQKEMKANREAMEAYPEKMEANPEEMKSVAEHDEVAK
jgi:DNA repair ATPase RecN